MKKSYLIPAMSIFETDIADVITLSVMESGDGEIDSIDFNDIP